MCGREKIKIIRFFFLICHAFYGTKDLFLKENLNKTKRKCLKKGEFLFSQIFN